MRAYYYESVLSVSRLPVGAGDFAAAADNLALCLQFKRASGTRVLRHAKWSNESEVAVAAGKENSAQEVNLEAAAALIAALEQDLKKVSGDSRDIQRLRDEVETLKNVLNSPLRRPHWVKEGLQGVSEVFERAKDEVVVDGVKGGQYIAEIGRILGL